MTEKAHNAKGGADQASFANLVLARFEAQVSTDAASNFDTISQDFVKRYGPIMYSRFGKNIPCGVALTDAEAAAGHIPSSLARPKSPGDHAAEVKPKPADDQAAEVKPKRIPRREKRRQEQAEKWLQKQERMSVRLHIVLPAPASAQIVRSLSRCGTRAVYARRFLEGDDLRQCLTLLYWPADVLIALADEEAIGQTPEEPAGTNKSNSSQPAKTASTQRAITDTANAAQLADVVNNQLNDAEQYYRDLTQRKIRTSYFQGIGFGMIAVIGLVLLFYLLSWFFKAPIALLWSILAGALGALTSVLTSATQGRIILDRAQGGTWNIFLGAFRPIIGALFGAAFFALINAGFLPVKIPNGQTVALYASIAFLAGFSQRWAQDSLKAAEGRISATPSMPESGAQQEATARSSQQKM